MLAKFVKQDEPTNSGFFLAAGESDTKEVVAIGSDVNIVSVGDTVYLREEGQKVISKGIEYELVNESDILAKVMNG